MSLTNHSQQSRGDYDQMVPNEQSHTVTHNIPIHALNSITSQIQNISPAARLELSNNNQNAGFYCSRLPCLCPGLPFDDKD